MDGPSANLAKVSTVAGTSDFPLDSLHKNEPLTRT